MTLLDSKFARVGLATGTTVLAIAASAARYYLWESNRVLDNYRLTLLTVASVVFIVLAAAFIAYAVARARLAPGVPFASSRQDSIAIASLLFALATSVYAIAQISFPSTPLSAAAPSCLGAPVHGAAALGQTTDQSANARSGAGSAYPVQDRFGPNCTIGFDGFCIGEPIAAPNAINDLPDQRWLIVHDRSELVSASYIRLQSPQANLGSSASSQCAKYHGVAGPSTLKWAAAQASNRMVRLTSSSAGSILTSYAAEDLGSLGSGAYPYVWVADYSPIYGFVSPLDYAEWKLGQTPSVYQPRITKLAVVGEDCYADDAPILSTAKFQILTFRAGRLIGTGAPVAIVPNAEALQREACSID